MRRLSAALALLLSVSCHKDDCSNLDPECKPWLYPVMFSRVYYTRALYVANGGGSSINIYAVNRDTGLLTFTGSASTAAASPTAMAIHPGLGFMFITHSGGMQSYRVDATGGLTSINSVATGTTPQAPVVHPNGNWVYTVNQGSTNITPLQISSSGTLTALSNQAAGGNPQSAVIDPSGTYLYAINNLSADVTRFTFQATGALSNTNTISGLITPVKSAVDPLGRFIFITELNSFSVKNLTAGGFTSASSVSITPAPDSFTVDPFGRFLFACNLGNATVTSYTIANSGALTQTSQVNITAPQLAAIEPNGRFLYVPGTSVINVYSINQSTGALTLLSSIAGLALPAGALVAPGISF